MECEAKISSSCVNHLTKLFLNYCRLVLTVPESRFAWVQQMQTMVCYRMVHFLSAFLISKLCLWVKKSVSCYNRNPEFSVAKPTKSSLLSHVTIWSGSLPCGLSRTRSPSILWLRLPLTLSDLSAQQADGEREQGLDVLGEMHALSLSPSLPVCLLSILSYFLVGYMDYIQFHITAIGQHFPHNHSVASQL